MLNLRKHFPKVLLTALTLVIAVSFQNFSMTNTGLTAEELAHKMYRRVAGVAIPMDDARIQQMAALIQQNDRISAAKIAAENPNFLNITMRELAAKMSTRDADVTLPLNDFIAGFVGAVRDDRDLREILYANAWYRGNTEVVASLPDVLRDDILLSNRHYAALENTNLGESLIRIEGQFILSEADEPVPHPEPAGLLTSRAWQESHMTAGTNRAPIEALLRGFACLAIAEAHDTSLPDIMVGKDVARAPGGSYQNFQTTCKGCHSFMDGWRPAFAYFDFKDNRQKHSDVYVTRGNGATQMNFYNGRVNGQRLFQDLGIKIPDKFYRASEEAPEGFAVMNNSWVNFSAQSDKGQFQFGWDNTITSGQGLPAFGEMFSNAKVFSECMTKRTFRAVCRRDPTASEGNLIRSLASDFRNNKNHNLKELVYSVAARPECMGQ